MFRPRLESRGGDWKAEERLESTGGVWKGKVDIRKYRRRLKSVGGDRM